MRSPNVLIDQPAVGGRDAGESNGAEDEARVGSLSDDQPSGGDQGGWVSRQAELQPALHPLCRRRAVLDVGEEDPLGADVARLTDENPVSDPLADSDGDHCTFAGSFLQGRLGECGIGQRSVPGRMM